MAGGAAPTPILVGTGVPREGRAPQPPAHRGQGRHQPAFRPSAAAASPEEDSPACSPAWACSGPGTTFQGRPVSPRSTVPGFSGTNFVRLLPRHLLSPVTFCPGSEVPAVTTHIPELVPPTADRSVKSTHWANRWRYPPGHTRRPMPAPPPGLPWGVASRCRQLLGQLWAPGAQTWGPAEGK